MIRILQANINRSKTANDLLHQLGYEKGVDVLLISEQYRDHQSSFWYSDTLGTAAIWIREPTKLPATYHGCGRGYVWVGCRGVTFFSCYLTPNEPIQDYRDKVDALEDEILRLEGRAIVAGDFNARGVEWGIPDPDSRGKYLLEMASRTGLVVLNVGYASTFRRPGYRETIPDVSFASEELVPAIEGWTVLQDYTGSDHQYITFCVRDDPGEPLRGPQMRRRWNVRKLDEDKLAATLLDGLPSMTTPTGAESKVETERIAEETIGLTSLYLMKFTSCHFLVRQH